MRKILIYVSSVIVSVAVGCGLMYGVMYYFPNVRVETVNKRDVTVTDTGISAGVENVYDSVVAVTIYKEGVLVSVGSGFVYKTDGDLAYIMTNHHVIESNGDITVIYSDKTTSEAKLIGSDQYADIAVLSVPKSSIIEVAKIGSSNNINIGDTVFTIGTPMGVDYAGTVTRGILSGKDRLVSVAVSSSSNDWIMNVMQTDAAINPGNSGGPLCNVSGEIIGINSLKVVQQEVEGIGFSIPIEDALEYASAILSGNGIVRPYVGIEMLDISSSYALMREGIRIDNTISAGVVIKAVVSDSPAHQGGLERGDIIVKVGEHDVKTIAEFRYYLYKYQPEDKIEIKVYRSGEYKTLKVKLSQSAL